VDLGRVGAGSPDADLLRDAVAIASALVAALQVDPARLLGRTTAVVGAISLALELANVKRVVAGHASLPELAVARVLAGRVALTKGADER